MPISISEQDNKVNDELNESDESENIVPIPSPTKTEEDLDIKIPGSESKRTKHGNTQFFLHITTIHI